MRLLRTSLAVSVLALSLLLSPAKHTFGQLGQPSPAALSGANASFNSLNNQLQSAQAAAASGGLPARPVGPIGPTAHAPRQFPVLKYLSNHHAQKKARVRSSPLGKMLQGLRKPLSKLTGGLIPAEPKPNHVQLAAPGPQGSAAKIKKDKLEAPKRLAAVKELGEVDCHWYPEARSQLVLALRTDRSECVRFEAAKILSQGGCCNKEVIHALKICVAGTETDGNPGERSLRVRDQAAIALETCLACSTDLNPGGASPFQLRPEYPLSKGSRIPDEAGPKIGTLDQTTEDGRVVQTSYQKTSAEAFTPAVEVAEQARETVEQFRTLQKEAEKRKPTSLLEAWQSSK